MQQALSITFLLYIFSFVCSTISCHEIYQFPFLLHFYDLFLQVRMRVFTVQMIFYAWTVADA